MTKNNWVYKWYKIVYDLIKAILSYVNMTISKYFNIDDLELINY
jgi:hypothetical protein